MIILVKLILAHFVGDFLLQPSSWVEEKEKKKLRTIKFYLHILIHGGVVLLIFWDIHYWLLALMTLLLHGLIDATKLYLQREDHKPKWFLIDQVLHLISLLILWYIWAKPVITYNKWLENPSVWIIITAFLFLSSVTGVVIQIFLTKWSKNINETEDESLPNAGKYIGILERLFIFLFVITGNWTPIGFLLAAKSVFRFGDLRKSKDRKLTEYILIGTLFSFGVAILTGLLVLKLIK